jgi:hypothetical protein
MLHHIVKKFLSYTEYGSSWLCLHPNAMLETILIHNPEFIISSSFLINIFCEPHQLRAYCITLQSNAAWFESKIMEVFVKTAVSFSFLLQISYFQISFLTLWAILLCVTKINRRTKFRSETVNTSKGRGKSGICSTPSPSSRQNRY